MDSDRNKHLEKTRAFWQEQTPRQLTLEDARQIKENLTGFFKVLLEWEANADKVAANSQGSEPARRTLP